MCFFAIKTEKKNLDSKEFKECVSTADVNFAQFCNNTSIKFYSMLLYSYTPSTYTVYTYA